MSRLTILDGPLGTQLGVRGASIDSDLWSASANESHPHLITQIHQEYVTAGATVHTANTFRTQRRIWTEQSGLTWDSVTRRSVQLTRSAIGPDQRLAGSIAPLADCYRPELSPANFDLFTTVSEHRMMADVLADAGCDVLLCETFAHGGESLIAVQQAVQTGVETWLALTAGPEADLLTPQEVADAGRRAVDLGATAILINCVAATKTLPFVQSLSNAHLGVPIGAYANAGCKDDRIGWNDASEASVAAYTQLATRWIESGASIIGGCCGVTPQHIASLASIEA